MSFKFKISDLKLKAEKCFLVSCFLFLVSLSSCKVGYSFTGASIPADAKTFSVQYFQNNASLASPTYAQSITESLKDYILSQSRLSLNTSNTDLLFEGTVTDYNTSPISIQTNDQAAQNRLTITVRVKFTNKFDEKKNFEQTFSRFADYPSTQSLSAVESELIILINKQLVDDIYNRAFNNW